MEEKKLVPKLRFPGFTEPWEQRKFRSLFQKNLERNDGQFPFNKTISISRMIYSESGNGASTESLDNYKVLRVGDIAFEGHENKDFKFGRFVMNDVGNGIMSPRFTVLRPLIDMELNFWKEYINYEPIMQKKLVYSTKKGTMMNELVVEDFLNQYVAVPSVQEQQKIGYLLKCMTDDITLHQRKLEHLKLKKKSLLQKLFPKEGEVYPELRFPGFTDPWEQRKGDEIFISVSDKGYPQLPVLSASQELGMVYRDENGIDIHHNKSNEDTYKRVLPGQFVIHLRSFQGGFAYSNVEGITSPAYTVITFKNPELYYGLFWKQVFKSLTFIKHLETITYGIRDGRSISFSDFRSLKLCYPTYGEQKFIGDGLEKTDNLITLHQRKLEHLQLLKKALLQQLFV